MIILLDVDGVLANFVDSAFKAHGIDPESVTERNSWQINEWKGVDMSMEDFWKGIDYPDHTSLNFWSTLKPYSWLRPLVDMCMTKSEDVYISTSPSRNPMCRAGKATWIRSYIPELYYRTMIGSHKYLMANDKTVLIDDSDSNVKKFRERGGHAITFPQPWNFNCERVDGRMEYINFALNRVRDEIG